MSTLSFFQDLTMKDVALAGGKGASLGEMTRAGIPVPPGFVIFAPVFDRFLQDTDLAQEVQAVLSKVNEKDVASVDHASREIRALIQDAHMPDDLAKEITEAYQKLGAQFVAVRSSATAEDSSSASWAGELESYLNTTEETLIDHVKKCWSSLFTPRAIVYRHEKGLKDVYVSVAVVVQKMVQNEIAGITFTVHPVTKDHNQMIIEACWGLGEMIVGGMVTPDSYVLDKTTRRLIDVNVSEQEKMLCRSASGNEEITVPNDKLSRQKLAQEQILALGDICMTIEKHYGFPCDIEWGMEENQFYIVQSRPITTL